METQFDKETLKTTEIITSEDAELLNSNSARGFSVDENVSTEGEDVLETLLNDDDKTNFGDFS